MYEVSSARNVLNYFLDCHSFHRYSLKRITRRFGYIYNVNVKRDKFTTEKLKSLINASTNNN